MTKVLSQLTTALLLAVSCFLVTGCGDAVEYSKEAVEGAAADVVDTAKEAGEEMMDKAKETGEKVMDKAADAGKEAMSGSDKK